MEKKKKQQKRTSEQTTNKQTNKQNKPDILRTIAINLPAPGKGVGKEGDILSSSFIHTLGEANW